MKHPLYPLLLPAILCFCMLGMLGVDAVAQQATTAAQVEEPAEAVERDSEVEEATQTRFERRFRSHYRDDVILHFGDDSHLPADASADAVISIFGSSTADGEVYDAIVSIFGNTRARGPVGNSAVSVFGDTYVNGRVGENVVAVFGRVELGPEADIDGDIVAVGGTIERDPAAIVHGDSREIAFAGGMGSMQWLRTWVEQCLLYARPLAFEPGLGWAWMVAFGFLAFYVLIALLFGSSVEKCVETIERHPGPTVVASILSVLLTPVLMLLLIASIVGIVILPFVGMILLCAALFGKAVILAALGRRVTRFTGIGPFGHVAFAVLVGGLIVLGLYVIPVFGFIVYKLLGILGLGVVVYTTLLALRLRRLEAAPVAAASGAALAGGATIDTATFAAPPNDAADPATDTATPAAGLAASTLPRAGFWMRMGALLIDIVLVAIIVSVLDPPGELFLLALASYGAVMWKLKATTIGGIVFGLKVVRRDGREISWDTAVVRALGCFLSLIAAGLGFLWILFDEDRQAWHDKIAGTLVVREPKGESLV